LPLASCSTLTSIFAFAEKSRNFLSQLENCSVSLTDGMLYFIRYTCRLLKSTVIAALGKTNDCIIVTDIEKNCEGVEFIDPMRTAG